MLLLFFTINSFAQHAAAQFGKGLNFYGADSSFHIKFGFRFQNLYEGSWNLPNDNLANITDHNSQFLIRRSRLKFDGFAFTPRLAWKIELALTNRDMADGAVTREMHNASNLVLDAYADYRLFAYANSNVNTRSETDFYGMFVRFGQGKLPGNIERVISSGNLQLVERSIVNAEFNIDRDLGIQIWNKHKVAGNFIMKEKFAFSQGEGRNVTRGSYGGYNYTGRVEFLPFGMFKGDGDDYVGSALVYYNKPKAMIGLAYDINNNAVRTGGQLGSFIKDKNGNYYGEQLNTFFADAAVKYKRFSFMGEYASRKTKDNTPEVEVLRPTGIDTVGRFITGNGLNLQAGIMLNKNGKGVFKKQGSDSKIGDIELVGRYTTVNMQRGSDENQYTLGFNAYFVDHKLKLQADITYNQIAGEDDGLLFRTQLDVHF